MREVPRCESLGENRLFFANDNCNLWKLKDVWGDNAVYFVYIDLKFMYFNSILLFLLF